MNHRSVMERHPEGELVADGVDPRRWVRRHLLPHAASGMRVLDVGCGEGTIAAEVARRLPDCELVALDSSEARLSSARRKLRTHANASAMRADAHALPFDDASFDLVYSRFLLGHLPYKQRAVAELARVCRPGGTVLLQDLDGQFVNNYPPDPELQRRIGDALALLAAMGFDPHVGRRLRSLLQHAGLSAGGLDVEPYHVIAGAVDAGERGRWQQELDRAASALTRVGLRDADALAAAFVAYLDRDDTITVSYLFSSWAYKP